MLVECARFSEVGQRDVDVVVGKDPAFTLGPVPYGFGGSFRLDGSLMGRDPVCAGKEFDPIGAFEALGDCPYPLNHFGRVGMVGR